MKKSLFVVILVLLLLASLFLLEPLIVRFVNSFKAKPVERLNEVAVNPEDPFKGPADAPITLVEFSSFTCPVCKNASTVMNQLLALYPEDLKIVWKDFPHDSGLSTAAAMAARCAQLQGKFWQYHDALYANQSDLLSGDSAVFVRLASQLNLNVSEFSNCLDNNQTGWLVSRDVDLGLNINLSGVPYYDINNKQRVTNSLTVGQWQQLLNEYK